MIKLYILYRFLLFAIFEEGEGIAIRILLGMGVDIDGIATRLNIAVSSLESWCFDEGSAINKIKNHFKVDSLEELELKLAVLGGKTVEGMLGIKDRS